MIYDKALRRVVYDKGWTELSSLARVGPIEPSELTCPSCEETTEILVWEDNGGLLTKFQCVECDLVGSVSHQEVLYETRS